MVAVEVVRTDYYQVFRVVFFSCLIIFLLLLLSRYGVMFMLGCIVFWVLHFYFRGI